MRFNDLPLLLRLNDVIRVTGLSKPTIDDLVASGTLSITANKPRGWRLFTRESVRKFLDAKGDEIVPS